MNSPPLLVFDVNETLLDIETLAPHFGRMFGDPTVLREWFAQMILYSEAVTLTGGYVPFGALGAACLRMVAAIHGREICEADIRTVQDAIVAMPPHRDVPPALTRLRDAGFRLFALTNNPLATCEKQLERAGLRPLFERLFSVDGECKRYKPASEAYRMVEQALDVAASNLCLIACHAWDTLGAAEAGWQAALILRPGNMPFAIGKQPGLTGKSLTEIAEALIERYRP